MTKEQFISGVSFRTQKDSNIGSFSYRYSDSFLFREIRSGITDEILTDTYHLSVEEILEEGFTGYAYVLDEVVNVSYKFEDLVVVNSLNN